MSDARKIAYTVECFLNAVNAPECPERVACEAALIPYFILTSGDNNYAIYQNKTVQVFVGHAQTGSSVGSLLKTIPLECAKSEAVVWCDGKEISALDNQVLTSSNKLIMLGAAGLAMVIPGIVQAKQRKPESSGDSGGGMGMSSNNNNNNNNNNNG